MQDYNQAHMHLTISKYKPYNSSTPVRVSRQFFTFLFTSQREREAIKDERTLAHHGAMDKKQICIIALIFCILLKNLTLSSYG